MSLSRLVAPMFAVLLAGCGATVEYAYSPSALAAELRQRAPELQPGDIVVPHAVPDDAVRRAKLLVEGRPHGLDPITALVDALSAPDGFGLEYHWAETADAYRTLATRRGNCLSLASVLVGIARGLGHAAYFADASREWSQLRTEGDLRVQSGHIAVIVLTHDKHWLIDFSGELSARSGVVLIDDLAAVAHYHNNRGYERIHFATKRGDPVPWTDALRDFELATKIKPDMRSAWNNVAVAYTRLGLTREAERARQRASALAPL